MSSPKLRIEQSRAHEQDDSEADLRHDERATHSFPTATSARTSTALLERAVEVRARRVESGEKAEDHAGPDRDGESEREYAGVGLHREQARERAGVQAQQQVRRRQRERGSERAPDRGEQYRFREELAHEPRRGPRLTPRGAPSPGAARSFARA